MDNPYEASAQAIGALLTEVEQFFHLDEMPEVPEEGLLPEEGRKARARFRRRLLARLREAGNQELLPGFPANVLADGLAEEIDYLEGLRIMHKTVLDLKDKLLRLEAAHNAAATPGAERVFHERKALGAEPDTPTGEAVQEMKRSLRAGQGRRRRRK